MDEQVFFVDEFFADGEDEGIPITLISKGREVPIWVKRNVTVEDRLAAELSAVTVTMVDGKMRVSGVDQAKATMTLVTKAIKRWPFTDRTTGELLPITPENVARFIGAVDPILTAIGAAESESAAALVPSETPSADASMVS